MFQVGDKVLVIDENHSGKVVGILESEVTIETEDGFQLKYLSNELIKVEIEQSAISSTKHYSFSLSEKVDYKKGKKIQKAKKNATDTSVMEVDLHIEKLVKSARNMDNFDILNLQLDTAKYKLEFALKSRISRIVFIHGVGEGVLKQELEFLFKRYSNIRFFDASYQKYGMGATEVNIIKHL